MVSLLDGSGYTLVETPEQAEVLIVNTCGFIAPAREESYQVLADMAAHKRKGQLLVATGCLTQRYGAEVVRQAPGIDGVLGTRRWMDILDVVEHLRRGHPPSPLYHLPDVPSVGVDERGVLRAALQGASAYLKIADGCRHPCAFCAIPAIKGTAVSRPMDTILAEAHVLQELGIKEVILIAQDTTDYGHDLSIEDGLAELLVCLVNTAPEINWWRIMYAFPGCVSNRLIEVMAANPRIVPYLDIPLQHAHPAVLRRMVRPVNMDWVYQTLEKMRVLLPGLAIRTTFIVGYPGETEAEFQMLLDFVQKMRFDRVGAFEFSFEAGTASEPLGDPVPVEVKRERLERLMQLQQDISLEKNQALVGQTLQVLFEGQGEMDEGTGKKSRQMVSVGRSYRDAPEIDGLVLVEGDVPVGVMLPVRITGAMAYDLTGVVGQ